MKTEESLSRFDSLKWMVVFALIIVSVYANSVYAGVSPILKAIIGVIVGFLGLIIAIKTRRGAAVWELAKEARVEIRKVVWPTTPELTQTTLIVVVVVVFVGFILWGLDSGLSWAIQSIIG